MSETVVAKASPTVTATGPATGTAGTAIRRPTSARSSPRPPARAPTGTITFTVFGPRRPPRPPAPPGARRSARPRSPATPPTTRRPATRPTTRGNYWWYASYGGDANNNAATSTCGSGDVRDRRGQGLPTLTATGPATGTAGTAITAAQHQLGPRRLAPARTPPAPSPSRSSARRPPPRPPAPPAAPRSARPRSHGNGTYTPSAGYTPTGSGNYWWYASYGGDANNSAATSTCGSAHVRDRRGQGVADGDGDRPGDRHGRDRHHGGATSARRSPPPRARTPPAPSPSRSSARRPPPRPPAPPAGRRWARPRSRGNATYHPSAGYTPTAAGNYWWYASYGGDTNNNARPRPVAAGMSETRWPRPPRP